MLDASHWLVFCVLLSALVIFVSIGASIKCRENFEDDQIPDFYELQRVLPLSPKQEATSVPNDESYTDKYVQAMRQQAPYIAPVEESLAQAKRPTDDDLEPVGGDAVFG